ncbi:MAG: hypothetical protein U0354_01105 [Candidatus Sericytochromatia bacterium]
MCISGFSNRLNSSYQGKILQSKDANIKDTNSVNDNVLDLTGDKQKISNEINSSNELLAKDINSIKAVKIDGKLIKMNPEQLKSLVNELQEKCLNPDNSLKDNFKFAYFEKGTGISLFETELDISLVKDVKNLTNDTNQILNEISSTKINGYKQSLTDTPVYDDVNSIGSQHEQKSLELGKKIVNIESHINKLNNEIINLKTISGSESEIQSLQAQIKVLSSAKDLLKAHQQVQNTLSKTTGMNPTQPVMIANLSKVNLQLEEKTYEFKSVLEENSKSILDDNTKKGFENILNTSLKSVKINADVIKLSKNNNLTNVLRMSNDPQSASVIMLKYNYYCKGVEDNKLKSEYNTADPEGFTRTCIKHLENDKVWAKRFDDISKKVESGEYKNKPEQLKLELDKMFKDNNNRYFISSTKVQKIITLYDNMNQAVRLNKDVKGLLGLIDKELNAQVHSQILLTDDRYFQIKNNPADIKISGFGEKTKGEFKEAKDITDRLLDETKGDMVILDEKLAAKEKEKRDKMTTTGEGVAEFLEETLGYDSKVSFKIGAAVGAEASLLGDLASGRVEAGIGASFTVEKTFGHEYNYTAHIDFHFDAKAEGTIGFILSGSTEYKYDKVLFGVGFKTPDEIEVFSKKIAHLNELCQQEKVEEAQNLAKEIFDELAKRTYDSSSHTVKVDDNALEMLGVETFDETTKKTTLQGNPPINVVTETERSEIEDEDFKITSKKETSTMVKDFDTKTPIAASKENPFPIISRTNIEIEIDLEDLFDGTDMSYGDEKFDYEKLAKVLVKNNPDLEALGEKELANKLKECLSNLENIPAYQEISALVDLSTTGKSIEDIKSTYKDAKTNSLKSLESLAYSDLRAFTEDDLGKKDKDSNKLKPDSKDTYRGWANSDKEEDEEEEESPLKIKTKIVIDISDDAKTGNKDLRIGLAVNGKYEVSTDDVTLAGKMLGTDSWYQTGARVTGRLDASVELNAVGIMSKTTIAKKTEEEKPKTSPVVPQIRA